MVYFFWIVFSFIVGFLGSGRKVGFFGALVLSLLLSPLIGLIITMMSKRKQDEIREISTKLSIDYGNYLKSRELNPNSFTVRELEINQQYLELEPQSIPNSQIGKPIFIKKYYNKENKKLKQGKKVLQIQTGDMVIDYDMPYDGRFIKLHTVRSFLKPSDMLCIVEGI